MGNKTGMENTTGDTVHSADPAHPEEDADAPFSDSPITSFYRDLGDGFFESTVHAQGAWNPHEQHMAPVSGILTRAIELFEPQPHLRLARINFEILGLIEGGRFEIVTRVLRPGRTIQLIQAELIAGGRVAVRAFAWRLQRADTSAVAAIEEPRMPSLSHAKPADEMRRTWPGGYIHALEFRNIDGHHPGRGQTWLRTAFDMVEGQETAALVRLIGMVDTANGVAARVEPGAWMFPNVDLSVHLFREPMGEWLGLDVTATFGTDGIGMTSAVLNDYAGPFGRSAQILTVRELSQRP